MIGWVWALVLAGSVWAQPAAPDAEPWNRSVAAATAMIEEQTGSDADLAALRQDLQRFRDVFVAQQGTNAAQIAALKEQIAALGPAPEGDAVETAEVGARRKALHDELAKAQEPVVRAGEAQAQAEALLRALIDLDRARQAGRMLRLSPSPLTPEGWTVLAKEAQGLVDVLVLETQTRVANRPAGWFADRILGVGVGVALGLVMLVGGWRITRRGGRRLVARFSTRMQVVTGFVVSVLSLALPIAGLHLMVRSLMELGVFGPWWRPVLSSASGSFAAAMVGFWVVRLFFDSARTQADYQAPARHRARAWSLALVVGFALYRFVSQTGTLRVGRESVFLGPLAGMPDPLGGLASAAVVAPLLVLAAAGLWGVGCLRRGATTPAGEEDEEGRVDVPYRVRMLGALLFVAKWIGLGAVVAGLVGYVALANYAMWSTVVVLGLALFLLSLHDFITAAWAAATNRPVDQGLVPVLAGFALVAAALPLFALAWGMRPDSLWETARKVGQGFPVGDVTLSPSLVAVFALTLGIGVVITRVVKGVFKTAVLPRTRLDSGAQSAAVAGLGYVGVFLAVLIAVMAAGIDLSSLAIVAGALSVGIGFGLQNIISNFVSGIILLIERPISVGDWIDAGGQQGTVRSVSVRSTRIRTFDNTEVIVPNSDLISNSVTNWTRGSTIGRVIVPVTVAFGTDTEAVEAILLGIADRYEDVLGFPAPQVFFANFSSNGYAFELRAFLRDIRDHIRISTLMRHAIVQEFAKAGIVIPAAVQEVRVVLPDSGPSAAMLEKKDRPAA